jgi:hypothetical protein
MARIATREWAAANWFLLALPVLAAISFLVARSAPPGDPAIEAVTLFDWAVTIPILYFLCYRCALARRQMAIRLFALVCLGIWAASRLVPLPAQQILPHLSWPRMAGLAVLLLIELRLLVLGIKYAFSGRGDAKELAERTGAPVFLARLMLLEARFWRAVWRLIRRR